MTDPVALVRSRLAERGCRIVADRGERFAAQCPAHDDRTPSLTVATGEDGRALLDCKAGCPIENVLAELGLDFPDLFSSEPRTPPGYFSPKSPPFPENSPVAVAVAEAEALGRGEGREDVEVSVAWLRRAVEEFDQGRREPEFEVRLPRDRLPRQARTLRSLADRIALGMSLQLTAGDTRPFICSGSFAAWLIGRDDEREARRMLDTLVRVGVLREQERLGPRFGRRCGSRCFEPPDLTLAELFALGGSPIEREPEPVELAKLQPAAELADEPTVNGAEPAGSHVGMVATGDRALSVGDVRPGAEIVRHERDSIPGLGAEDWFELPEEDRVERMVAYLKDEMDAVEEEPS